MTVVSLRVFCFFLNKQLRLRLEFGAGAHVGGVFD